MYLILKNLASNVFSCNVVMRLRELSIYFASLQDIFLHLCLTLPILYGHRHYTFKFCSLFVFARVLLCSGSNFARVFIYSRILVTEQ